VGADLVVVALPGVQRFIAEARSTSDVSAASGIYSRLAEEVVRSFQAEPGGELILPEAEPETPGKEAEESGMPNRVVALLPAGTGTAAAVRAVTAARNAWRVWVRMSCTWQTTPLSPKPRASRSCTGCASPPVLGDTGNSGGTLSGCLRRVGGRSSAAPPSGLGIRDICLRRYDRAARDDDEPFTWVNADAYRQAAGVSCHPPSGRRPGRDARSAQALGQCG
jgi:hypothetical protein